MTARHKRSGLRDPCAFFEALRPARQACVDQLRNLRPYGPDYHMLSTIIAALDVGAEYFTKQRCFYTVRSSPDMIGRNVNVDSQAR